MRKEITQIVGRLVSFEGIEQINKNVEDGGHWFPSEKKVANVERGKARINHIILDFQ